MGGFASIALLGMILISLFSLTWTVIGNSLTVTELDMQVMQKAEPSINSHQSNISNNHTEIGVGVEQ